jgi:hypothetical protein
VAARLLPTDALDDVLVREWVTDDDVPKHAEEKETAVVTSRGWLSQMDTPIRIMHSETTT